MIKINTNRYRNQTPFPYLCRACHIEPVEMEPKQERVGARLILTIFILFQLVLTAQTNKGPNDFPKLIMTKIPGAPILGQPTLITGTNSQGISLPLISQGYGLAAPAYYDWDGDGLKDLLIGEFGSGAEFGRYTGNYVRLYLNIGNETQPEFTENFNYARPPFEYLADAHGTPYSVDQYCCMGFTPQFTDLNNDGYLDMFTGQYQGEVSWFQGSDKGFHAGEILKQEGNPRDKSDRKKFIKNQAYWLYSSASFGDFTGDGKLDMIVGGQGGLRISENIGTASNPQFAKRELLVDIQGKPLKVYRYTPEEMAEFSTYNKPIVSGDYATSPLVVDWDQDGVLDLLVTNNYNNKDKSVVDFFKGVKNENTQRFMAAIPLFTAKNGEKAIPGTHPHVFVTDWNNDGVNDLLIGTSVVIMNNEFNSTFSWHWEKELGLKGVAKDPSFLKDILPEKQLQSYWEEAKQNLPEEVSFEDYITLTHQGYVYLMLGSKENSKTQKAGN